jgi:adenylate cyclase
LNAILQRSDSDEAHELGPVTILGRSAECQIVVADPRVSRRHAMVRKQDGGYYLFDLGSFNGSYLNGSRVTSTRQLRDGDVLSFADHEFRYRERGEKSLPANLEDLGGSTIALIRSTPVVLFVSDIKGFTSLSESVEADELAQIIGSWYSDCERILGEEGATVDKFIGDSVLAYWTVVDQNSLRAALRAARGLLESSERIYEARPDVFGRIGRTFEVGVSLHTGKVAYGGMSQGEFTLVGDPVNLAFRLETLTRELGAAVIVSGDFVRELPELRPHCRNHGVHRVKGRAQGVEVFSLREFPPE